MKKVSVIVPVYNAHNTIARCLGSLVHQTLKDIEIIVVNDNSADDTWNIISECKTLFPEKIVAINSPVNRGSGGARNQGIDAASGEYIGFVDSDDYVSSRMFELLYNKAKEGDYDIVDCGYYSEANNKAVLYTGDNETGILNDKKRGVLITSGGYLVTKIFRRELFNEPKIREREKVRCLEDADILIYMLLRAVSIGNVKEILYNYCDAKDSATKMMDLEQYADSVLGAMSAIYYSCKDLDSFEGVRKQIEYAIINLYSYGINRCLYDRIVCCGADLKMVKSYFQDNGTKEKALLKSLAELKHEIVAGGYEDNPDIQKRISKLDIEIMKECDRVFA